VADEATDGLVWRLEAVRFPEPVTRWSSALFTTMDTEVVARVTAETGVLLDGVAAREFDGRVYTAIVPLGGARTARWLVPVLRRVRPELRRRLSAAHAADVADWSGLTVKEWKGGAEVDLLERGRGFLAGDLAALTAQQVAARLEEQLRFVEESFTWRARLHAAAVDAVGRLGLELSRDHGWPVAEIMDLFVGLSGATTDPAVAQLAIVDLVRSEGAMPALEHATTLADLAETSPAVANALQSYQDLWGQRAVRYELAAPTVVDRPEWLLRQLKYAARAADDRDDVAARHAATRMQAQARLIATLGNSSLSRRRLARAEEVFPLREGNAATTIGVPLAGLRRLGLHIGVRLGLYRPEDVFDLTFDEVLQVIRHPDLVALDEGTDAAGVAQLALTRREERERLATKVPPTLVGDDAADQSAGLVPPDLRGFPRSAAEQLAALIWYAEQVAAPLASPRVSNGVLLGIGVSPGVYEGTARVVRDEDDFELVQPGDVMVCPITSPVWSVVFPSLGALVCDGGGAMSHPAVIAREFGIPAVVATVAGTTIIAAGSRVRVDGQSGQVTLLA
jgi:rifampicin phosphotransferase